MSSLEISQLVSFQGGTPDKPVPRDVGSSRTSLLSAIKTKTLVALSFFLSCEQRLVMTAISVSVSQNSENSTCATRDIEITTAGSCFKPLSVVCI